MYEFSPGNRCDSVIHIAHANGFPPEVYGELAAPLTEAHRVVALPARPLWEPSPPPNEFYNWRVLAEDMITGLESLAPVIGIGHSLGGVSTLIAAIQRPDLFSAIILLDPVLFPRSFIWWLAATPQWVPKPESPLVKKALRRRQHWQNEQEAFDRFRSYSVFAKWSDEALWAYVRGLTSPTEDGIVLRYAPQWEARIYETAPRSVWGWWRWLPNIEIPTLVLQGENTDTFVAASSQLWTKVRPDLPVITVPETGHLFPIEAPIITAQHILTFIDNLGD